MKIALYTASLVLVSSFANATVYTSTGSPYDVTLDTGSYAWNVNNASVDSGESSSPGSNTSTTTNTTYRTETDAAQPGVAGSYTVFQDTTTNTYQQDYQTDYQSLTADFSAGINAPLETPETFVLSGSILKQAGATLIQDSNSLGFSLGLSVGFQDLSSANTVQGQLSFMMGDSVGNWTHSFSTHFDSVTDFITLADAQTLDFSSPIYFQAVYEIAGTNGVPFQLNGLTIGAYSVASSTAYGPENLTDSQTDETVVYSAEIPALPVSNVPLPASGWLFMTALMGTGLAGKRRVDCGQS